MAGSITETYKTDPRTGIRKVTLDWTADGSGNVSGINTTQFDAGEIMRVVFIPDGGGTQPDADYDVTLEDPDNVDVLLGRGVDRSQTATEQVIPILDDGQATAQYFGRPVAIGPLELTVAGAGASNGGTVIIYWK
jgi:hypothetical protein